MGRWGSGATSVRHLEVRRTGRCFVTARLLKLANRSMQGGHDRPASAAQKIGCAMLVAFLLDDKKRVHRDG
jgi:hypothetical protein